jgi:endonuclease/exonuclease/phosphatase (EEP) superfamily protein YafD
MIWLIRILGFLLLLVTLLPLLSTGKWFVRGWDFPRLQIALLFSIPLALAITIGFSNGFQAEPIVWIVVLSAGLLWQISHVIQFSPFWRTELPDAGTGAATTKLMIANLRFENQNYAKAAQEISEEDPDILLLIEPNDDWLDGLRELRKVFKCHHDEPRDDGLGLALWSKHEIQDAETREIISKRRPSIWAKVELADGQFSSFVAVHPTPPGLKDETGDARRDSRVRDAELILIAKEVASQTDRRWIIAGDFNDVAWSHTTRLFKRTSGLKDPRVGRTFMGTFIANVPPLRCPLDHVFLSSSFAIKTLTRKRITGSDHFSVLTEFQIIPAAKNETLPVAKGNDEVDAERLVEEGQEQAKEREVLSNEWPEARYFATGWPCAIRS